MANPVLRRGDQGEWVTHLQITLNAMGGDTHIAEDGVFGHATQDAVERLQADHGLSVDGVVGHQTWSALGWE